MFITRPPVEKFKGKVNPREEFSQIDIILIVAFLFLTAFSILQVVFAHLPDLAATTNVTTTSEMSSQMNKVPVSVVTILALIVMFSAFILRIVLLFRCAHRHRKLSVAVMLLNYTSLILYIVAAALAHDTNPHRGSWFMAAAAVTLLAVLTAVFNFISTMKAMKQV
ncbi:unnamed protein product [Dicrocoelium dendriticum]|nr:unnamed protein product [Dicrocoelium dendriticum]